MASISPHEPQSFEEEIQFLRSEIQRLTEFAQPSIVTYRVLQGFLNSVVKQKRKTDHEPDSIRKDWKLVLMNEIIKSIHILMRYSALFDQVYDPSISVDKVQEEIVRSQDKYITLLPFLLVEEEEEE